MQTANKTSLYARAHSRDAVKIDAKLYIMFNILKHQNIGLFHPSPSSRMLINHHVTMR